MRTRTILEHVDCLPPFLVIALARNGRKQLSIAEISRRSGISLRTVWRLTREITWRNQKFETMERLCAACGVNLADAKRHLRYIRNTLKTGRPFCHLRRNRLNLMTRQLTVYLTVNRPGIHPAGSVPVPPMSAKRDRARHTGKSTAEPAPDLSAQAT